MSENTFEFRAWHKKQKRMFDVYGFSKHYVHEDSLSDYTETTHDREDCILMLFSGILDEKKKQKIFQKDIVEIQHPCWSAKCIVEFISGAFFFVEIDNPVNNAWLRQDNFLKERWKIKKLGNIFQNEELTK